MKVNNKIISLVLIFFININCSNEPINIEKLARQSKLSFQEIEKRYESLKINLASTENDILANQNKYAELKKSKPKMFGKKKHQEKMDAVQQVLIPLKTKEEFYNSELSKISPSYQLAKSKNESLQNLLPLYREIEKLKQEIKAAKQSEINKAKQSEINKLQNELASKTMSYNWKMALLQDYLG
jgi:hypothetical protein